MSLRASDNDSGMFVVVPVRGLCMKVSPVVPSPHRPAGHILARCLRRRSSAGAWRAASLGSARTPRWLPARAYRECPLSRSESHHAGGPITGGPTVHRL